MNQFEQQTQQEQQKMPTQQKKVLTVRNLTKLTTTVMIAGIAITAFNPFGLSAVLGVRVITLALGLMAYVYAKENQKLTTKLQGNEKQETISRTTWSFGLMILFFATTIVPLSGIFNAVYIVAFIILILIATYTNHDKKRVL